MSNLSAERLVARVVKLAPRIYERYQGVPQAEVQRDQDRKKLLADLVRQVLNHQDKDKLVKEFAEQPQQECSNPKLERERNDPRTGRCGKL